LKKKCPKCNGTGRVLDSKKFGGKMRRIREKLGFSLRGLASEMGCSHPHLYLLEKGVRNWNSDMIEKFKKAVGQ
jgi:transcriptional regulator with XRE-family HTH domain